MHWQQDRRVLDYCDRHGILLQSEIPAWGYDTFQGMCSHPLPELMQNGLEQLQEMIERDRNMPPEQLPQIPEDRNDLKAMLKPYPGAGMAFWPVDRRVADVRNDNPDLFVPHA